jgi:hypothetical protein
MAEEGPEPSENENETTDMRKIKKLMIISPWVRVLADIIFETQREVAKSWAKEDLEYWLKDPARKWHRQEQKAFERMQRKGLNAKQRKEINRDAAHFQRRQK